VTISVVKRDGTTEAYDADKINRAIERAAEGLPDATAITVQLASELELTLYDGITTEELDQAAVWAAVQNVQDDPDFDVVATRLFLKTVYRAVVGDYTDRWDLVTAHAAAFAEYVTAGVTAGLLDPRLGELFDLGVLAAELDPTRDDLLHYIGAVTIRNRYSVTDPAGRPLETPQFFFMRVAMGLSVTEPDPTAAAILFYNKLSRLEYLAAGSTLVNAGTRTPQLSNCFVVDMEDDLDHIAATLTNVIKITKGTGGIGLAASKLRAEGSPIKSNNTNSTGPVPFLHTIDSTLRAISRGGKKFGALCVYLENWHLNFPQFLDLKQNSGDPYRRLRTANTAVWISDEFMARVAADADWTLFDPAETADLTELTGSAFAARYREYEAAADRGEIRAFTRIRAREQWRSMLITLQSTSHPWLTWKDAVNGRALNDNTGPIHLSNLCTEICLPQDRDNISVCNLASVNLSTHLVTVRGIPSLDWDRLEDTVRVAVRQLDDLVEVTRSLVVEADRSNDLNRAVGLGLMGFTDVTERLGWAYDSPQAEEFADTVTEFISFVAIDASADLARERGAYPNFHGSGWSRGLVPFDTLARLEAERGVPLTVDRTTRLDWDSLRVKVAGGMRNATLMAIAPTASIGLIAGTTPALDPQFSQIFSRSTSNGKFLEVNRNLVTQLKARKLWDVVRVPLLQAQGDLDAVEAIPADLRAVFRTSFSVDPAAFVRICARAQKWVDQAISRNIYLRSRSVAGMDELYTQAWELGVKTTYYLFMEQRHTAEQSTTSVNKAAVPAGATGTVRRGFGARTPTVPVPALTPAPMPAPGRPLVPAASLTAAEAEAEAEVAEAPAFARELAASPTCPIDPAERAACDSCQ
jgi:ribonucleoside-diphosphate reductase alpha chain